MTKGAQIAIGATLVAGLLGWYAWTNLDAAASYQYFQSIEELHAAGPPSDGRSMRLHGYVAEGSIERDVAQKTVRFEVQNDPPHAGGGPGPTIRVHFLSLETPDLFKDGAEVVVEGSLETGAAGDTVIVADNVLAKCPSKFAPESDTKS
ncbi:MAG: cytochrome c maturation protein CcmE [Myxococcota bacterium]